MQGYFKRVFEISFTAVHKAMPKCMPEESLAPWQSDESLKLKTDGVQLPVGPWGPFIAGSNPAVCFFEHIASGMVTAGNGTDDGVRKHARTLFNNRNCSAEKWNFPFYQQCASCLVRKWIPCIKHMSQKISFRLYVRPLKILTARCT